MCFTDMPKPCGKQYWNTSYPKELSANSMFHICTVHYTTVHSSIMAADLYWNPQEFALLTPAYLFRLRDTNCYFSCAFAARKWMTLSYSDNTGSKMLAEAGACQQLAWKQSQDVFVQLFADSGIFQPRNSKERKEGPCFVCACVHIQTIVLLLPR